MRLYPNGVRGSLLTSSSQLLPVRHVLRLVQWTSRVLSEWPDLRRRSWTTRASAKHDNDHYMGAIDDYYDFLGASSIQHLLDPDLLDNAILAIFYYTMWMRKRSDNSLRPAIDCVCATNADDCPGDDRDPAVVPQQTDYDVGQPRTRHLLLDRDRVWSWTAHDGAWHVWDYSSRCRSPTVGPVLRHKAAHGFVDGAIGDSIAVVIISCRL